MRPAIPSPARGRGPRSSGLHLRASDPLGLRSPPPPLLPPPSPPPPLPASLAARSPGAARRRGPPPLPQGQTCGPLPGWPTAREGRRVRGRSDSGALGPLGPLRAPPARPAPSGCTTLCTRAARPRCSTYLQRLLSGHHSTSWTRAARGLGRPLSPRPWAAAAAARARGERQAPPWPPAAGSSPARPRRALHGPAPRPLARSATSRPQPPPRRFLLPFPLFLLLRLVGSRGWQTSTCCWRSPRTETGNPGPRGKPGRRGEGEGSCWNLSARPGRGAARRPGLRPPRPCPPRPSPGSPPLRPAPRPAPGGACPPGDTVTQHEHASSLGSQGNRESDFLGQIPHVPSLIRNKP